MAKVADLFAELSVEWDKRGAKKARKQLDQFAKGADKGGRGFGKKFAKSASKSIGKGLTRVGAGLLKGGLLGAGVGAGFAIKDLFKFDEALTKFDITSESAGGSIEDVRKQIIEVSNATGVSKEALLEGAAGFTAYTGRGKEAMEALSIFARVSKASFTPMSDISATAGAMSENFGIATDQMEGAFSILIQGGKQGSVEMEQMAGIFRELAPSMTQFAGGRSIQGIATLNASLQATNVQFGSLAEASTGFERFTESLADADKKFAKLKGTKSFFREMDDGTSKLGSMDEILDQIAESGIVKDPRKLREIFPNVRARKFVRVLLENRDTMDEVREASLGATDVQDDFAKRSGSSSEKVAKAWNSFKNVMSDLFVKAGPAMAKFVEQSLPAVGRLLTTIGKALGSAVELGKFLFDKESRDEQAEDDRVQRRKQLRRGGAGGLGLAVDPRAGGLGSFSELTNDLFGRVMEQQVKRAQLSPDTRAVVSRFQTAEESAFAAASQTVQSNITINAPNADAKEVERLVRAEMDKKIRQTFFGGE